MKQHDSRHLPLSALVLLPLLFAMTVVGQGVLLYWIADRLGYSAGRLVYIIASVPIALAYYMLIVSMVRRGALAIFLSSISYSIVSTLAFWIDALLAGGSDISDAEILPPLVLQVISSIGVTLLAVWLLRVIYRTSLSRSELAIAGGFAVAVLFPAILGSLNGGARLFLFGSGYGLFLVSLFVQGLAAGFAILLVPKIRRVYPQW